MNCRAFNNQLEDYLEGRLNFSCRFGMERHAQQCISCGKELSDAQQLRRMVSDLQRVKAPIGFESSVLRKIAARKAQDRRSGFRRFWIYGFEWPSLRKMFLASSALVILGFGIFFVSRRTAPDMASTSPQVSSGTVKISVEPKEARNDRITDNPAPAMRKQVEAEAPRLAKKVRPAVVPKRELLMDQDTPDVDYVEYMMPGEDNQPMPVRLPLPKRIPMRYGQMSEEYFIRNVSH